MRAAAILFSLFLAGSLAAAGEASFSAKPTAAKDGDKVKVSFAVAAPTDVEVAVLGADGKVVRHLAAGVLGGTKPPPEPLKAGLSQSIEWDGKDDFGKPAKGEPFKVRVRAGLAVKVGAFIGDADLLEGMCLGVATDDRGQLYVATAGGNGANVFTTIKVFDRDGKYLKTILPYPASLKVEDVNGFAKQTPRDGKLNPPQFHDKLPWIYPANVGGLLFSRVQGDALWLVNGNGQIGRIRSTDGACLAWGGVQSPASTAPCGSLGPICWAAAPDGKTLYLSGWVPANYGKPVKEADGRVYKVDPATGKATEFVKVDVPPSSFWLTDANGWYLYRDAWGRKNGVSALHGVAVDKDGQVYVCDRISQRLAVYDPAGKLLGSSPVEWPDLVALSPKGPEIYVLTRKIVDGWKCINENRLLKLSGWKDGKVLAELKLPAYGGGPSMAVDATQEPAVIWFGTTRIEDRGKEFVITGGLNVKARPMPGAIIKVWADPLNDNVMVSDGNYGQFGYNGLTGEPQPWPLKGIDLAFDRDGNYYVCCQADIYKEPVARFDRQFKPLPFQGTGKHTTGGRPVYARMGQGFSNKGLAVGPDGKMFAYFMYDWQKYFVYAWDAAGNPEKNARVSDGLLGPVDSNGGGIAVDLKGNIYLGMRGWPKGVPGDRGNGRGTVLKFGPAGGGYAAKADKPGLEWTGSPMGGFVEGGLVAYPGLAQQPDGCVCKEVRFDLDGYGRVYVPNAYEYCIKVFDNAGNEIARLGYYGNADSRGPKSAVPEPEIPIGWPTSVSAGQIDKGRLYVGDMLNHRIARLEAGFKVEELCEAK